MRDGKDLLPDDDEDGAVAAGCVRVFSPLADEADSSVESAASLLGASFSLEDARRAVRAANAPVATAAAALVSAFSSWKRRLCGEASGRGGFTGVPGKAPCCAGDRPPSGGFVACSTKALFRCSAVTGICSRKKTFSRRAAVCAFAHHTALGPVAAVGCTDGSVQLFCLRSLRLLSTLRGAPSSQEPSDSVSAGASPLCLNNCRSVGAQAVSALLFAGNNALLCGMTDGSVEAFFLESGSLAAVYRLPERLQQWLASVQRERSLCLREEEAGDEEAKTKEAECALLSLLPVGMLSYAAKEGLVLVAHHSSALPEAVVQEASGGADSGGPSASARPPSPRFRRLPLNLSLSAEQASCEEGPCEADVQTAKAAASAVPLVVFAREGSCCKGVLWGASSRILAAELSSGEGGFCVAAAKRQVLVWTETPPNTASFAGRAKGDEVYRQQRQLHSRVKEASLAQCPSFFCGSALLSKTQTGRGSCRLAEAVAAWVKDEAEAASSLESPEEKPLEGGVVQTRWWGLTTCVSADALFQSAPLRPSSPVEVLEAVVHLKRRLLLLLPEGGGGCLVLRTAPAGRSFEVYPLRWLRVNALDFAAERKKDRRERWLLLSSLSLSRLVNVPPFECMCSRRTSRSSRARLCRDLGVSGEEASLGLCSDAVRTGADRPVGVCAFTAVLIKRQTFSASSMRAASADLSLDRTWNPHFHEGAEQTVSPSHNVGSMRTPTEKAFA